MILNTMQVFIMLIFFFKSELKLKDSAIKSKLIELLTELRVFKVVKH